jgi:hypothetical protein
VHREGRGEAE